MARIAVCQTNPVIGDIHGNLAGIAASFGKAVRHQTQLVIFPECAVTGYVFETLEEALDVAEPVPGYASQQLLEMAADSGSFIVAGLLERVGDRVYNTAILAGPYGLEAVYRKTHVLCLGVDRFTTPGDVPFTVHDLPFGRIGILICYDLRFPEPARILALKGVQAIVLPTNWPQSSTIQPDVFTRARAAENRVFVLAADRVGSERGATFLGRSQMVAPSGVVLAEASRTDTEMLIQDLDLSESDSKRVVMRAGEHEMDCFADRRPDLYGTTLHDARLIPTT
jgi:predicted amidohydrolase